jgi:hypothetical protein
VEPLRCRVSVSESDHGDNGAHGSLRHKWGGWRNDLLELRGYLTEGVLVLAGNRNDCIFLSPDDAVPEYNLIPNLLEELGAQSIIGNEKEENLKKKKRKFLRHQLECAA